MEWYSASQTDIGSSLGGVVKAWIVPPEFLILLVWGAAWECVFLTCSQEMLLLLEWGPYLEDQWSSGMGQGLLCGEFDKGSSEA